MHIQTLLPPVVGEIFRFNVAGGAAPTNVKVRVGERQILNREYGDLLNKVTAEIPFNSEGETLCIEAIDSVGNNRKLEYEISESNPGAHSMLAATR